MIPSTDDEKRKTQWSIYMGLHTYLYEDLLQPTI